MELTVPVGSAHLPALLEVPDEAPGVVVFAHGSGSGRTSPRNAAVAQALREAGLGTLLIDLVTEAEEVGGDDLRFDIDLLSERVVGVVDRLAADGVQTLACFGASTGAAAALRAAASRPRLIRAVVARGGRVDLAGEALEAVRAPVLLLVGGADAPVLSINREALERLGTGATLEVIPGAGHLFEEDGAMRRVTAATVAFLAENLGGR